MRRRPGRGRVQGFEARPAGRARRLARRAVRALERFPSADDLRAVFIAAGFRFVGLEAVSQVTADSLRTVSDGLDRDAHTPLKLISDAEFGAGAARLRAAGRAETGPVVDRIDLLVFR